MLKSNRTETKRMLNAEKCATPRSDNCRVLLMPAPTHIESELCVLNVIVNDMTEKFRAHIYGNGNGFFFLDKACAFMIS